VSAIYWWKKKNFISCFCFVNQKISECSNTFWTGCINLLINEWNLMKFNKTIASLDLNSFWLVPSRKMTWLDLNFNFDLKIFRCDLTWNFQITTMTRLDLTWYFQIMFLTWLGSKSRWLAHVCDLVYKNNFLHLCKNNPADLDACLDMTVETNSESRQKIKLSALDLYNYCRK
jgi:hypothetical protein